MRGLAALLAALFGFGTCTPAERPVDRPAVKDARCAEQARLDADVDGDGRMDTVFHGDRNHDDTMVGVCFATGRYAEALGVGMGEGLLALDVDGDGAEELLPGGTTVDSAGFDVLRYENGRLVRLGVTLERGHWDANHEAHTHAWGCDGPGRLVQVQVDWGRRVTTVTTYTVRGSSVTKAAATRPVPDGLKDRDAYLSSLVTECGRDG